MLFLDLFDAHCSMNPLNYSRLDSLDAERLCRAKVVVSMHREKDGKGSEGEDDVHVSIDRQGGQGRTKKKRCVTTKR